MDNFMKDRYGVDELTTTMGGLGMILTLVGTLANIDPLAWAALALVVLALVRAFSKNIDARRKENGAFRSFAAKVPGLRTLVDRMGAAMPGAASASGSKRTPTPDEVERAKRTARKMWDQRKTSRFLKCPSCGQILSVPKGKGKLRVTCPKCRAKMEVKS